MDARAFILRHPALFWVTLAVLPVALWFLAGLAPDRNERDHLADFATVEAGMTRAEVERALGGPAADYRSRPGFQRVGPGRVANLPAERGPFTRDVWYFDEGVVEVAFDRDGRAAGKHWDDAGGPTGGR